ncbi:MAG TPA: homoserine dehydrogenase [Bacilli bacterium]|jgi:homoserine dehydrogenase|nr:homoserine dehydrogenase [Acholeplasmataceae bacterium]HNZ77927.1 homoserine dehydrogenase [Bacilli bacterium]HOD61478.1 homoserine dehydrogenase [Bacilli bacterium]HOH61472.1 homoserine dehydrogenase [Bacilli bacterium]HPB49469.1 homoserine dehydrogenase [Bacilli bacterium]
MSNKIKIAILGLGTVGFGVYDIITKSPYLNNVVVTKILDKDLSKQKLVKKAEVTINYNDIIYDKEIKIVVETMGAGEFSYHCIKRALEAKKHVITANKEVIALHLEELSKLKEKKGVSLLYEASVGGGIPIIYPLYEIVKVNEVDEIQGILNGTTNFILTKMFQDGLSFSDSLRLAQEKGFAEADPTADLEGLDMVRKIAILSSIAYKGVIHIEQIDHFGITNINDEDLVNIKKTGGVLKLIASSKQQKGKVNILIEPTIVQPTNLFSTVNEENNLIAINSSFNGNLKFFGKGAGRYPTANAIVNDIIAIIEARRNYTFENKNKLIVEDSSDVNRYYVRLKPNEFIDLEYIEKQENNSIITKEISRTTFKQIIEKVEFYAKIVS